MRAVTTFTLADDATLPTPSPHTSVLQGVGVYPAVTLNPVGPVAFGNQTVGTTSAVQGVTLNNSGTDTLNINSITLTGTDSGQFTTPGTQPYLAAGNSCAIGITFVPTSNGAKSATLTISDDVLSGPWNANGPLDRTGISPAVSLSPTSLNFGNQLVGTPSARRPSR